MLTVAVTGLALVTATPDSSSHHVAFVSGSGFSQIVESLAEDQLRLGAPFVAGVDFVAPLGSAPALSIRLRGLYSSTRVQGITLVTGAPVDGWLDHLVLYPMLDWQFPLGHWFLNVGGGPGFGGEYYLTSSEAGGRMQFLMNLGARVGFGLRVSHEVDLWVENFSVVTDLPRAVSYLVGDWEGQSGGEDISNFLLLGVSLAF